jgi:hypothetical protein
MTGCHTSLPIKHTSKSHLAFYFFDLTSWREAKVDIFCATKNSFLKALCQHVKSM